MKGEEASGLETWTRRTPWEFAGRLGRSTTGRNSIVVPLSAQECDPLNLVPQLASKVFSCV